MEDVVLQVAAVDTPVVVRSELILSIIHDGE
jgi:hypothetical protein